MPASTGPKTARKARADCYGRAAPDIVFVSGWHGDFGLRQRRNHRRSRRSRSARRVAKAVRGAGQPALQSSINARRSSSRAASRYQPEVKARAQSSCRCRFARHAERRQIHFDPGRIRSTSQSRGLSFHDATSEFGRRARGRASQLRRGGHPRTHRRRGGRRRSRASVSATSRAHPAFAARCRYRAVRRERRSGEGREIDRGGAQEIDVSPIQKTRGRAEQADL